MKPFVFSTTCPSHGRDSARVDGYAVAPPRHRHGDGGLDGVDQYARADRQIRWVQAGGVEWMRASGGGLHTGAAGAGW